MNGVAAPPLKTRCSGLLKNGTFGSPSTKVTKLYWLFLLSSKFPVIKKLFVIYKAFLLRCGTRAIWNEAPPVRHEFHSCRFYSSSLRKPYTTRGAPLLSHDVSIYLVYMFQIVCHIQNFFGRCTLQSSSSIFFWYHLLESVWSYSKKFSGQKNIF